MAVSIEKVLGGVDLASGLRHYCGHVSSTTDTTFVIESNLFPVVGPWYSISLYLSAQPSGDDPIMVSFGLVGFNAAYDEATFYCSDEYPQQRIVTKALASDIATLTTAEPHRFQVSDPVVIEDVDGTFDGVYTVIATPSQDSFSYDLVAGAVSPTAVLSGIATGKRDIHIASGTATGGFVHLTGLLEVPDDTPEMCLRIEVLNATDVWIDNLMVDPHEGQYEYFDGNSINKSFPDDFRWMGGRLEYENKHFSLWYNNYVNTRQRLMSDFDEADQVYKPGMVEEWAPTGANIVTHWDAVTSLTPLNWVGDAFYPVNEVAGTPVSTLTARKSFLYVDAPAALT